MHLCHHSLVWLALYCRLGAAITNFTECIDQGNHVSLDMPIRCLDSKTGKFFFGDVNQISMKLNALEKVENLGEIRHETPFLNDYHILHWNATIKSLACYDVLFLTHLLLWNIYYTGNVKSSAPKRTNTNDERENPGSFKCRKGVSTQWHTEHLHQGTNRWPGVLCESIKPHHKNHCLSFCGHCSKKTGRRVAAYNSGPGCRCYSATQARKITLITNDWDFCVSSKTKVKNIGRNHTKGDISNAPFLTLNCPVKTLYSRTCWAESARQNCVQYAPDEVQCLRQAVRLRSHNNIPTNLLLLAQKVTAISSATFSRWRDSVQGSLVHRFDSTNRFHKNARHTTWSWQRCLISRTCIGCICHAWRISHRLITRGNCAGRASREDTRRKVREWRRYPVHVHVIDTPTLSEKLEKHLGRCVWYLFI